MDFKEADKCMHVLGGVVGATPQMYELSICSSTL